MTIERDPESLSKNEIDEIIKGVLALYRKTVEDEGSSIALNAAINSAELIERKLLEAIEKRDSTAPFNLGFVRL